MTSADAAAVACSNTGFGALGSASSEACASSKRPPKNASRGTMPGRRFAPLLLLLLLVSDLTQGAAAFDSAPSPESLPSVAGIGDHGYDTKPALKLGYNSVAVQNLSEPSASPSASPGCPTQCLDRSVPWWYRKECQACQGVLGNELTWTCPPTWPPQKLFIIFSMQRSATQTACYTVGSLPDTACVGELFNQGLFPRNITDPEQMLRDTFAARRSASGLAPCTWGFRLLYQDGLQHPQLLGWLWDILDASIILERSNGALCTCPFCY